MNRFKIAFANMRKQKCASITFFVMVMLSALMLSVSLSLMTGAADFYDKKSEELNAPHYTASIAEVSYKDEFLAYAKKYDGVTGAAAADTLLGVGAWKTKSNTIAGTTSFLNERDKAGSFYNPPIIDAQDTKAFDMIILPVGYKFSFDVKSGEKIKFEISGKNYEFTVYGFYEDAISGPSSMWQNTVYIGGENFNALKNDNFYFHYKTLMVRFAKAETHVEFSKDFANHIRLNWTEFTSISFDDTKSAAEYLIGIISVLLILFSVIILAVAFFVVAFSIMNSIAEDISAIGALKSIGYKNKTLRSNQLIQYLLIAAAGSIIGALVSLALFSPLGNVIASTSGFLWLVSANVLPVFITITGICGLTALVTFFATGKYKKITPINALRSGEHYHSFKKNPMPLEKKKMPLNLHLGLKRFFGSIKYNAVLGIVVALLVFVSSVVYVFNYNFNDDRTAMVNMMGIEMSDMWIEPAAGEDLEEINAEIKLHGEVARTLLCSVSQRCSIDGTETLAEAYEDYSALLVNKIVKGEYPGNSGEIILGSGISKTIGKGTGDTVTLELSGIKKSYIVSGITQNLDGSAVVGLTFEAMRNHRSDFRPDTMFVYLNNGTVYKDYESKLKNMYGNRIRLVDINEEVETILNSFGNPIQILTAVMVVITVVVIAFILFLMLNALIRRQKDELGIMKAMGYKSGKLILQILILFLPALVLGTATGIILGLTLTNPLASILLSAMGLLKTYFIIPLFQPLLIGIGILGAGVLTAYLISLRIRSISPQKLITEQ